MLVIPRGSASRPVACTHCGDDLWLGPALGVRQESQQPADLSATWEGQAMSEQIDFAHILVCEAPDKAVEAVRRCR